MFCEFLQTHPIASLLVPVSLFHPYPKASERTQWKGYPAALRSQLIQDAQRYLHYDYPAIQATDYMAFSRSGDRLIYETPHFARRRALEALILGECAEGKGRFLDDIINGLWHICEESFWGVSAHRNTPDDALLPDADNPYIDLFAAETAATLAWCLYLMKPELDAVTPAVSRRVLRELERRVKRPYLDRYDFWWMGYGKKRVNNWAPWITANVLTVFLLCEHDEIRRAECVEKAGYTLDCFLQTYGGDGGCDEGVSYWNVACGALFDALDLLKKATAGQMDFYADPKVREMARYVCRCHIHGGYFINFADGSAKPEPEPVMLYRIGRAIQDNALTALAVALRPSLAGAQSTTLRRRLPFIESYKDYINAPESGPPYIRDIYLDDLQLMVARESNCPAGLYLAAKGGHNAESHNHNDVGTFILFVDGKPGLIDIGVEQYSKKTFSASRYELWTMQSQFHNLPMLNGVMQANGRNYAAGNVSYRAAPEQVLFSLDLDAAYPDSAGIVSYKRIFQFDRGETKRILLSDAFVFQGERNQICENFMTWNEPVCIPGGVLIKMDENSALAIRCDCKAIVRIESRDVSDEKLKKVWTSGKIYRMMFYIDASTSKTVTFAMEKVDPSIVIPDKR